MSSTTRKRAVRAVAPVAGLLAAGLLVWQGSYAAFSATTVNEDNAWATGELQLTNNGGGTGFFGNTSAIFTETDLNIGDSGVRCITVESAGSIGGDLRLYRGAIGGTANASGVANRLVLSVEYATLSSTGEVAPDCTGWTTGTALFGPTSLDSFPTSFATAGGTNVAVVDVPAAPERVAYRISYTLTTSGTTAGDNLLQGEEAIADLNWELQS